MQLLLAAAFLPSSGPAAFCTTTRFSAGETSGAQDTAAEAGHDSMCREGGIEGSRSHDGTAIANSWPYLPSFPDASHVSKSKKPDPPSHRAPPRSSPSRAATVSQSLRDENARNRGRGWCNGLFATRSSAPR
ncbi:hypothetical protein EJ06DRAFT_344861 [Trichodelitschia bisporula]|uniref:Secreted protein n=1 Tax=Trichodelitschia bisporula TaxID=703511 RepID=A0A6G1I2N1_9PEZI|nr:hypothetical protein EJ06DRAFT_344861 [Trichodelitschia bisporula]